jgi:hypothetical protein
MPVADGRDQAGREYSEVRQQDLARCTVATTILSAEIGVLIPNDVNIFVDETTKLARSIDETTAFVCELLKKQNDKEAAAA